MTEYTDIKQAINDEIMYLIGSNAENYDINAIAKVIFEFNYRTGTIHTAYTPTDILSVAREHKRVQTMTLDQLAHFIAHK